MFYGFFHCVVQRNWEMMGLNNIEKRYKQDSDLEIRQQQSHLMER